MVKKLSIAGLFAGLLIMIGLIVWQGVSDVSGLLVSMSWQLLLVTAVWLPTLFIAVRSGQLRFPPRDRPGYGLTLRALWIGRAVNTLLPVATIGGEVVKARVLAVRGCDAKTASASVMVDKTVQVLAMIGWGLTGVFLLLAYAVDNNLALAALAGFAVLGAGVAGFIIVQRAGMFAFMAKAAHKATGSDYWSGMIHAADRVDEIVRGIYRRRGQFLLSCLWRYLSLVLQTAEVWLAAWLLGYPLSVLEAVMLKSLSSTLVDAAFLIPNGYGIQEGAFITIGALLGMPAPIALTLSLAIRVRELIVDVPGLLALQHMESRQLLRRAENS